MMATSSVMIIMFLLTRITVTSFYKNQNLSQDMVSDLSHLYQFGNNYRQGIGNNLTLFPS
jgi:hypothetical protein